MKMETEIAVQECQHCMGVLDEIMEILIHLVICLFGKPFPKVLLQFQQNCILHVLSRSSIGPGLIER